MTDGKQHPNTVDDYLEASLYDIEDRLVEMRRLITAALPDAEEIISHDIPSYRVDGVIVVQFSGQDDHTSLNFFPTAATFARFADELATYSTSKSAIRFPLDEPLPVDLIEAVVMFRADEAAAFAARKKAGR